MKIRLRYTCTYCAWLLLEGTQPISQSSIWFVLILSVVTELRVIHRWGQKSRLWTVESQLKCFVVAPFAFVFPHSDVCVHLMCKAVQVSRSQIPYLVEYDKENNTARHCSLPEKYTFNTTRNKSHLVEAIKEKSSWGKNRFSINSNKRTERFAVMIQMSVSHTWSLTCCSLCPLTSTCVHLLLYKTLFLCCA